MDPNLFAYSRSLLSEVVLREVVATIVRRINQVRGTDGLARLVFDDLNCLSPFLSPLEG
jgi:hypothetical protein